MIKRKGRRKPNPKLIMAGDPILETVCSDVKPGDDIAHIIKDMMYLLVNSKNGVGIAAPQAGYSKRIIIIREDVGGFLILINPTIERLSEKEIIYEEGCLSYPKIFKEISRPKSIILEWVNIQLVGKGCLFEGREARIIQHELDHLDGKCKMRMDI